MDTPNPQSRAERDALFDRIFAGLKPAEPKSISLLAALKPYRRQLILKRREGFSLRQIAERLKASPLAIDASPSTIKAVIGGEPAKRRAKMKRLAALRAANLAKAAAANAATASVPARAAGAGR